MARRVIRKKPVPYCPDCGARMVLKRPRLGQRWQPFWGCNTWPDCSGTREIGPDGRPEEDNDAEYAAWKRQR
jgi:ssDNA-binding Zn-finger/Zn-ribbon topoisomerase 1